jgi:hypothetical protein
LVRKGSKEEGHEESREAEEGEEKDEEFRASRPIV